MKKLALFAMLTACAVSAFAALEFSGARAVPVIAPASISSGATNTAAVAISSMKGVSEVIVYATAAANRTALNVSLWTTNTVDGGWTLYADTSTTNRTATIVRLPFDGQYVPRDVKVGVGSIGASSTASAFILTY